MEFYKFTPLGFNCELAFVLQKRGHAQNHEFFAWTFSRARPVMRTIESDFLNIAAMTNLQPHPGGELVWDVFYDVSFHSPLVHGGVNTFAAPEHERLHAFFLSGVQRKARRFMAELKSDLPIAYLLKYDGDDAAADAVRLRDLLALKRQEAPFHLYFIQESERAEGDWNEPGLSNRYVSRFSPILDAQDIDHDSWARALFDIHVTRPLG